MTLAELLETQAASQERRFGSLPDAWPTYERIDYVKTQVLGALDELHEVLGETGWKPWKSEGYGTVNRDAYLSEISDVLVFVTNLVIAVGGTPDELEGCLRATQAKNQRRM